MPKLEEFIKERGFVTDRISTQVRIIGVGLLATAWSLLFGKVDVLGDIILQCRLYFISISTIAMIALTLDYLQYLFSYFNIKNLISKMENEELEEVDYDYDAKWYRLSKLFFAAKQWVLLAGIINFAICMFFIIFN